MQLPDAVQRVHYGGLVVAVVGFLTSAIIVQTVPPVMTPTVIISELIPLSIGLGLSVVGVALAVGTFSQAYVTTVTRWCLIGTATIVLVFLLTAVGSDGRSMGGMFRASESLIANILLAGAVGGVLIGDRSAKNRRQRREIRRQANRGTVLNRVLRDEVLNAVAVVNGYAPFLSDSGASEEASDAIEEAAHQIERTVEEVGAVAADPKNQSRRPVDLTDHLLEAVEVIQSEDYEAEIHTGDLPASASISADARVGIALRGLLRHGVENARDGDARVTATAGQQEITVEVTYPGSPLEPEDEELLRSGTLPEYDDPNIGFDLQTAWLLVDRYGGRIDADNDSGETRLSATLPRAAAENAPESPVGAPNDGLVRVSIAGLVAGVVMGVTLWWFGDGIAIIGALYGFESVVVGWITHLFHSVVFALLFVALTSWPPLRDRTGTVPSVTLLGVVWSIVLAIGAAGVLMPVWLGIVGAGDLVFPNVTLTGVLGHMLWGVVLGATYGILRERSTVVDEIGLRIRRTLGSAG